jgi:hypothetical protein
MNIVYEKPFKIGYPWKPKANSVKLPIRQMAAPGRSKTEQIAAEIKAKKPKPRQA